MDAVLAQNALTEESFAYALRLLWHHYLSKGRTASGKP
jgi:hypothetical protein